MFIKRFLEWIKLKEDLHDRNHKPPYVSEGDIWWAIIGENVGDEINGKNSTFTRPVIILKKLTRNFYFVVPATTQIRSGSWYVTYNQSNRTCVACLHQARAIDYRRLDSKLGELDDRDIRRIKQRFFNLYS